MSRSILLLGLVAAASAVTAVTMIGEREAAACGGCFHEPAQTPTDITDERMLLSVSPTQTTLYDQIEYAGTPSAFAWVLPIHGTVTVALSADVLFDSMDVVTATVINPPVPDCPSPPSDCTSGNSGFGSAPSNAGGTDTLGGVTVTKQAQVGPYQTVQLSSTSPAALNSWLTTNGYDIPATVAPIIAEYVTEGFDFLAMKLLPNEGILAMRPVRVTSTGASLSLPLRMAAIGTGATVGITIWVVSDGRYQPQNFPFFHIEDSALVWDFSTSSSNYTALRAQNEAALGGKGWEIESALTLNEQLISGVILSGGVYYPGGGVSSGPPSDASQDYLPVGTAGDDGGTDDGGTDDGGVSESADEVRNDDIATLFAGMTGPNVTVTRMRSDISHAAMTTDFIVEASPDQSELSNIRQVTSQVNEQCPIYANCAVIGNGSPAEAAAVSGTSSIGGMSSGTGGCVTAPKSNGGSSGRFALLGALFGLVVTRLVRSRRRKG